MVILKEEFPIRELNNLNTIQMLLLFLLLKTEAKMFPLSTVVSIFIFKPGHPGKFLEDCLKVHVWELEV